MQRRAMMLEPTHLALAQQRRGGGDERAHEVGAAERHRREDRRLGAAREQKLGHLGAHVLEAGGPAERADLVRIALAIDVGSRREQPLDHGEMTLLRRPVQRGGLVVAVARVDAETEPQQQVHAVEVAVGGCDMQQRPVPVAARDRDLARVGGEQLCQRTGIAGGRRHDNPAVEALRIDARLERTPAPKAIFPGNVELRLMQLRRRCAGAHLGQPLLGDLLEPIDVRLRR